MIRLLLHILLQTICASLLTKPVLASDRAKITLEQAKKYAIEKNFRIRALKDQVTAVDAERGIAKSSYLPRLGLVGGVSSYGDVAKEIGPVAYGYASYNIFNGYRDQTRRALADIELEKAQQSLAREKFVVGLEVEKFFHSYIYFSDLIGLQQSAISLNNDHKALVKKTKSAGRSSQTDVMEFQLKDAILNSDLELLHQKLEETRTGLKMLLGEEVGAQVTPVGAIQHQHLLGTLMSYLDRIKKTSLPVRMASLELKESQAKASTWKASWLPKVDLEVQAGRLPLESRDEKQENNVRFLLTAKYELFSGFEAQSERKKRDALLSRDENILKHNILYSITEMESTYRRLKTIEKRVDLEERNVDRSLAYYHGVTNEYMRGYKNSSDLASAADRYTESRKRKIQFMYDFLMEKLKLEKAMGAKVDVEIID